MSQADTVSRFCPGCGAKVRGNEEKFTTPQICPNCKSRVLFWDVSKEPAGDVLEATKITPLIRTKVVLSIAGISLAIVLVALMLLLLNLVDFAFALAVLLLLIGGYCIAIFLGQQIKISIQSKVLKSLMASIEKAREQQIAIAVKYSSLQDNFESLLKEATFKSTELVRQTKEDCERIVTEEKSRADDAVNEYEKKRLELQGELNAKLQNETAKARETSRVAREATQAIASRFLSEVKKILIAKISPENLNQSLDKFQKSVEFCRKVGFDPKNSEVNEFTAELREEYKAAVRRQLAREEQARIKEKLREEQKVEAEFQREMKRLEQEEKLLERLLKEARSRASEESLEQIADLERRLAEAKQKERALSMAQQTKAGNVYVISNIGSFGEGVFKIGMTRRLVPAERIQELGDASVPFPFDVHMMIACENAPTLENELHRRFTNLRMNKVNFRKEFFRVSLDEIRTVVEDLHGEVEYQAEPEALQYRESLSMTNEQFETVAKLSESITDESDD